MGAPRFSPQSLGAARDRLEAAELILSSLIEAGPRLQAALEAAQQRLINCRRRLDAKVKEVVASSSSVRRTIEDFYVARATFTEKYRLMRALTLASMLPPDARDCWKAGIEFYEGAVNAPLPEPWRNAVSALRSDANATLPD
jgi:hypothetical protein